MDRDEAVHILNQFLVVHEVAEDEAERLALTALAAPPSPPGALGALATEAAHFANLVTKTGEPANWATPPQHSEAMEQLAHRLTNVLEAFLDLYEGDVYLPLLVQVYQMITQRGMSTTDVAGVIFQWSVRDRKLRAALEVRPATAAAAAATKNKGATL